MNKVLKIGYWLILLVTGFFLVKTVFFDSRSSLVSFIESNAKEIVYDKLNTANNNKLIISTGKFELSTVSDELFKITVDSIELDRIVEIYSYYLEDGVVKSKWQIDSDVSLTVTDNKGAVFNNIISNIKSQKFYSDAKFGAFTISKDNLSFLVPDMYYDVKEIDGYKKSGVYLTTEGETPIIGDIRISYKYLKNNVEYTILAKQNMNTLEPYIIDSENVLYNGIQGKNNISDFVKLYKDTTTNNTTIFLILFIVEVVIGILIYRKKLVKKND